MFGQQRVSQRMRSGVSVAVGLVERCKGGYRSWMDLDQFFRRSSNDGDTIPLKNFIYDCFSCIFEINYI